MLYLSMESGDAERRSLLMMREEMPKLQLFSHMFNSHFERLKEAKKNKMITVLENLTDELSKTLINLSEKINARPFMYI